jgi:hypothetical protein
MQRPSESSTVVGGEHAANATTRPVNNPAAYPMTAMSRREYISGLCMVGPASPMPVLACGGATVRAVVAVAQWRVERLPAVMHGPHGLPAPVVVGVRKLCGHVVAPLHSDHQT